MNLIQKTGLSLAALTAATFVPIASQAQTNLVANSGFETGNFSGWTLSGNTLVTTVGGKAPLLGLSPHSGNDEALLTGLSLPFSNTFATPGFLSQNLTTVAGQTYSLDYFLANVPLPGVASNGFETLINNTKVLSVTNIGAQGYQDYHTSFVASGPTTNLKFGYYNNLGTFELDDVRVVLTPETPAGLLLPFALLPMGLIAFKAGRKRTN